MYIKDFQVNTDITAVMLCISVKKGVTRTGNDYLWMTFQDKTGSIDARLWDVSSDKMATWKKGQAYEIRARVTEFNQGLQLRVINYKSILFNDQVAQDLFPQAPIDVAGTWEALWSTIRGFHNQNFFKILSRILTKHQQRFLCWPAGISMHHAVQGGLLWHTSTMLQVAKKLQGVYQHLTVNWELVYSGIILHDLGKILEINRQEFKYTTQGSLIGHIALMQAEIASTSETLGITSEDSMLLQHMVLASHGKLEYGSPIVPKVIEAEILSLVDLLDARLYIINEALSNTTQGDFTGALRGLEYRSFFCHQK